MDPSAIRVGIIGSGVVGSVLGAYLAKRSCETYVVDTDKRIVDAINRNGISIQGVRELECRVKAAFDNIDHIYGLDLNYVFVCLKAYALDSLKEFLKKFSRNKACIIGFQNGIDTEEIIALHYPRERVFRGVVNYAGVIIAPGKVKMTFFHQPNYIGCFPGGEIEKAKEVATLLAESGLETLFTQEIKEKVWLKSILNAALMPVAVVTRLSMDQIMNLPGTRAIIVTLLKEFISVARAEGFNIQDDFLEIALNYLSMSGGHVPSMLVDFEKGEKLELDFLNRKLQICAKSHGISCNTNKIMLCLVEGLLLHRDGEKSNTRFQ